MAGLTSACTAVAIIKPVHLRSCWLAISLHYCLALSHLEYCLFHVSGAQLAVWLIERPIVNAAYNSGEAKRFCLTAKACCLTFPTAVVAAVLTRWHLAGVASCLQLSNFTHRSAAVLSRWWHSAAVMPCRSQQPSAQAVALSAAIATSLTPPTRCWSVMAVTGGTTWAVWT